MTPPHPSPELTARRVDAEMAPSLRGLGSWAAAWLCGLATVVSLGCGADPSTAAPPPAVSSVFERIIEALRVPKSRLASNTRFASLPLSESDHEVAHRIAVWWFDTDRERAVKLGSGWSAVLRHRIDVGEFDPTPVEALRPRETCLLRTSFAEGTSGGVTSEVVLAIVITPDP